MKKQKNKHTKTIQFSLIALFFLMGMYLFSENKNNNLPKDPVSFEKNSKQVLPNQIKKNKLVSKKDSKSFEDEFRDRVSSMKDFNCKTFYGDFYLGKISSKGGNSEYDMISALGLHPDGSQDIYFARNEYERYEISKADETEFNLLLLLLDNTGDDFSIKVDYSKSHYMEFNFHLMLDKIGSCFDQDLKFISKLINSKIHERFEQYSLSLIDQLYNILENKFYNLNEIDSIKWKNILLVEDILLSSINSLLSLNEIAIHQRIIDFELNKLIALLYMQGEALDSLIDSNFLTDKEAIKIKLSIRKNRLRIDEIKQKFFP